MAGRQICHYFLKGNCTWGDECWYEHVKAGDVPGRARELRVDPSDGNAYPKSSFLEVYGGLAEWNV